MAGHRRHSADPKGKAYGFRGLRPASKSGSSCHTKGSKSTSSSGSKSESKS